MLQDLGHILRCSSLTLQSFSDEAQRKRANSNKDTLLLVAYCSILTRVLYQLKSNNQSFKIFICLTCLIACKHDGFNGKDGKRIIYVEGTKTILQSVEYKNGLKNGAFMDNYKNGTPHYRAFYVNDTLQDSAVYYHPNGKIFSVNYYIKGKKTGCWRKYNQQGDLYQLICFKDDLRDSVSLKYSYKSVKLIERFNYLAGMKDGRQECFYNSGKPKSITYFSKNQPCLGFQEWDESGKKVNNDFTISITEQNKVLMEGFIKVIVKLENPRKGDQVYERDPNETSMMVSQTYPFEKKGDYFEKYYFVARGTVLIKKLNIAAFRKTFLGNTAIKLATYNLSSSNY